MKALSPGYSFGQPGFAGHAASTPPSCSAHLAPSQGVSAQCRVPGEARSPRKVGMAQAGVRVSQLSSPLMG